MHVLHLTTEFPPRIWGGMGRSVPNLCKELAVLCKVTIVVHDYLFQRTSIEVEQRGPYTIVWTPTDDYGELKDVIAFDQIDVVNAQIFFFDELVEKIGKPTVYTVRSVEEEDLRLRGVEVTPDHRINFHRQRRLVEMADRLIVCSQSEGQVVERYYPGSLHKLHVIPNGFSMAEEQNELRVKTAKDRRTILFVGRFSERKGIHVLIKAFYRIWQQMPDARLLIVGGHSGLDDEKYLEDILQPFGSEWRSQIEYVGWVDSFAELQTFYAKADVLCVPSLYEPFGNIVLEGFSQRIPVVVSRVGGLMEIVEDFVSGLLVEPGHAESLADALLELLQRPELCERLTARAFDVLQERYRWSTIAQRTLEVYEDLVAHTTTLVRSGKKS